jgi:LEA14-like dessication related protein
LHALDGMRSIFRKFFLSLCCAATIASCSLVPTKLETPHLSIVDVELLKSDIFEQRLRVRMRVQNPNDRALPVRGLSYKLEVQGQDLAQGVSGASFVVPALGETEFDMNVSANMAGALVALLGRRNSARNEIEYRVVGKVSLSEGLLRSIPFEERGTLKLD